MGTSLVQGPEQWTRSSAYLRDLKKDSWLLPLKELFPEVLGRQVYPHYRAQLLYRGVLPSKAGGKAIPQQALHEEERQGLYRKQLRYFTDGLVVGSEECIRDWIHQLRQKGQYLRRRHPIMHGRLASLREQRSLVLCANT